MTFHESVLILPDPDDFHVHGSTLGREPSPAEKRALEIYHASIFRRIEERRRRREREDKGQADATS